MKEQQWFEMLIAASSSYVTLGGSACTCSFCLVTVKTDQNDIHSFLPSFLVTGSCFIIFSSALKASAGYLAKSSVVEGRIPSDQRSQVNHYFLLTSEDSHHLHFK